VSILAGILDLFLVFLSAWIFFEWIKNIRKETVKIYNVNVDVILIDYENINDYR
jgi:hypothetical protein